MTKETRLALAGKVTALETAIRAAVKSDYPDLMGYLMQKTAIVRTGPYEDDWQWAAPSSAVQVRRHQRFLREAVSVAASRISEAYGIEAGAAWARKHFLGDKDAVAASVAAALVAHRGF